jgi:hypothetical protein
MGVKEDLQDLFAKISKLRSEPEKLRTAIAGAFLVVGFVMVKMPLAARFATKQNELRQAQVVADQAEKVDRLEAGVALFAHRLKYSSNASEWQAYYYQVAEATGVGITRFEDARTTGIYEFKISKMEITAIGSYAEIVGFIDALERGSRLVRLEEIKISLSDGALTLKCRLLGITRDVPDGVLEGGGGPPENFTAEEDVA